MVQKDRILSTTGDKILPTCFFLLDGLFAVNHTFWATAPNVLLRLVTRLVLLYNKCSVTHN